MTSHDIAQMKSSPTGYSEHPWNRCLTEIDREYFTPSSYLLLSEGNSGTDDTESSLHIDPERDLPSGG